jgi:3'(2'), 5'-bisphosphate nucleotidase
VVDDFFIDKIHKFGEELANEVVEIQNKVFDIKYKKDSSPLTEADLHANERIKSFLLDNYEICAFISEEDKELCYEQRSQWERYWVIDPIDGTKEFVKGNDDYCINIALCEGVRPVYGHVIRPRTKDQYYAIKGKGAFKNRKPIKCNTLPEKSINVVASKSHLNKETELYIKILSQKHEVNTVNIGSALKLCLVAEGKADIYPRHAPTMEWDTCAAQIIVEEAGGIVVNIKHKYPLTYNKDLLKNPGFVATCDKELIININI